jgi:hypothetical protein
MYGGRRRTHGEKTRAHRGGLVAMLFERNSDTGIFPASPNRVNNDAVEFSSLAAREKDPERRQDLRDLAKLHWNDAYGRRRRYWYATDRGGLRFRSRVARDGQ